MAPVLLDDAFSVRYVGLFSEPQVVGGMPLKALFSVRYVGLFSEHVDNRLFSARRRRLVSAMSDCSPNTNKGKANEQWFDLV